MREEIKVRLIVWSAPYSSEHYKKIISDPEAHQVLKTFKTTLLEIFDEIYDFTNENVHKYDDTKYFQDSTHPTRELFRIMLEDIFLKKSEMSEVLKK